VNIPGFSKDALAEVAAMLKFAESPCSAGRKPKEPHGPKEVKPHQVRAPRQPKPPGQEAEAQRKAAQTKASCPG
jgi:hypothetical protein